MLKLFSKVSQVAIHVCCRFFILKFYDRFYPIFPSSESFYFKSPPNLRCMKIERKFIIEIVIFCDAMVCKGCLNQKI